MPGFATLSLYSLRPSVEVCWECPPSSFLYSSFLLSQLTPINQSLASPPPMTLPHQLWHKSSSDVRFHWNMRWKLGWALWILREETGIVFVDPHHLWSQVGFTKTCIYPLQFLTSPVFYYPKRIVVFTPLALNYIALLSYHSQTY